MGGIYKALYPFGLSSSFKETHACTIVSSESSLLPPDFCVHGSTELYLFRSWASIFFGNLSTPAF